MAGLRGFLVRAALVLSLLLPVWFLVGALGTKFGLLDWRVGFGLMTYRLGPLLLLGALGLAVVALLLALVVPPRRGRRMALAALLFPLLGLGYAASVRNAMKDIPPIHDISTDLTDPPVYSDAVAKARAGVTGGNDLVLVGAKMYTGKLVTEVQKAAYPDLKPYVTDAPPADAFEVALDAARAQEGWVIGRTDPAAGVIEASATSFWYGFVDDISIRVRALPDGSGSTVDMRSVSRVGVSDLGANAKRIRAYMGDLNTQMGEAATGG